MSRIQQILAKAERDGTARRMGTSDDTATAAPPLAPAFPVRHARHAMSVTLEEPPADPWRSTVSDESACCDDDRQAIDLADEEADSPASMEAVLHPVLIAALDPLSPAAEQYRALRSRIGQAENGQAIRVIQVTSPAKGDGKTVTSLNLALTMAQEFQRRVLVLDADLRQPRVDELLGLSPGPGLVDVLTGTADLEESLVAIPDHNLTVLRAGRAYDRPAELLGSAPMRRLVDTLRTQFDRIVVDSPPTVVSDPGTVAALVDRLLLVVRAGTTTTPAIARAISVIGSPKLLGLVFNESVALPLERYRTRA